MDFQSVLIETIKRNGTNLFTTSGTMLNEEFIMTTINTPILNAITSLENIKLGVLTVLNPRDFHEFDINVVWPSPNKKSRFKARSAKPFALFMCGNIFKTSKSIFKDWAIDSVENNQNLNEGLSIFVFLKLNTSNRSNDVDKLRSILRTWWTSVGNLHVGKTDELICISTAFGNRNFMNSFSKGIVSNIFGPDCCLILTDCPTTPASEGSPVYLYAGYTDGKAPIGMTLSSLSWWRGEPVGLTLVVDIRSILAQLMESPVKFPDRSSISTNFRLLAFCEFSLVQIYCGSNWGTAVLVDLERGLLVTNAHVVSNCEFKPIALYWKMHRFEAEVVYKSEVKDDDLLDVAVLRVKNRILPRLGLIPVVASNEDERIGDCVFSAGFALYPKEAKVPATLSKGVISQVDDFCVKTTCSVYPGHSGGAIFRESGEIVGIIVGNTKVDENGKIYARSNVAIRFGVVELIIKNSQQKDKQHPNIANHIKISISKL